MPLPLRYRVPAPDTERGFLPQNLAKLSYAQGFTLWKYHDDRYACGEILADGFFDSWAEQFHVGDVIYIVGADSVAQRWVSSVTSGVRLSALLP